METMKVYYANELYHHGIEGQKWGVRRYQNEDGSLTEEGRNRYNKIVKRETKQYERGEYGHAKRRADKKFDRMQRQLDYENENGGALTKTKYKYNLAKLEKEAYDKIDQYAKKTIKEIDPDSYKTNVGKSVVASLAVTLGSLALAPFTGVGAVAMIKEKSDAQKNITTYAINEEGNMWQKQAKEREKYKNAKKFGREY